MFLAQKVFIGGQKFEGPLKNINTIADVINVVFSFIYPFAGLLLLIYLIWGGFEVLISSGDADKLKTARSKLNAAFIGIVLLILSYFIVRLVSYILGIGQDLFV